MSGLDFKQRSSDNSIGCSPAVLLADTIGEMGIWLRLAQSVYLGGATAKGIGGHNPIEPLKLRKPIFTGPYSFNFADLMKELSGSEAVQIGNTPEELSNFWKPFIELNHGLIDNFDWNYIEDIFSTVDDSVTKTIKAVVKHLED